jgi:hypothetical protein
MNIDVQFVYLGDVEEGVGGILLCISKYDDVKNLEKYCIALNPDGPENRHFIYVRFAKYN